MEIEPSATVHRPVTRDVMRLLRSEQQGIPSKAHNIGLAVRLVVPTTREQLTRTLAGLAARHAALRTAIVSDAESGLRFQVLRSVSGDLLRWSAAGEDVDVERRVRELMEPDFDLAVPPLWRFELLDFAGGEQVLLYGAHHAVSDAKSLMLVMAEIGAGLSGMRLDTTGSDRDIDQLLAAQPALPAQPPQEPGEPGKSAPVWRDELVGIRRLDLTLSRPRPAIRTFRSGTVFVDLPDGLMAQVLAQADRLAISPAAFCLGTLTVFLARLQERDSFALAVPVDTRRLAGAHEAVGYFGIPFLFAAEVKAHEPVFDVLRRTNSRLSRLKEQGASFFDAMSALVQEGLYRPDAPLVEVTFNFIRPYGLKVAELEVLQAGPGYFDLDLMVSVLCDLGHLRLDHNLDIIDEAACRTFGQGYLRLLAEVASGEPEPEQAPAAAPARRASVALAATFAVGDLGALLAAALDEDDGDGQADSALVVAEAPYHQVLASLQDPAGVFADPSAAVGVVLLRAADLARFGPMSDEMLSDLGQEYHAALRSLHDRTGLPVIVGFLPSRDADAGGRFERWERELASRLRAEHCVAVLLPDDWRDVCPVADPFDEETDALAHLPFQPEFQAAVALTVAAAIRAVRRTPPKVIAVDGDGTLWDGEAGEVGPDGVDLSGPRTTLARRLLAWRVAGVLLVLVSNNDEATVRAVLKRPDSLLHAEDFCAISAGWAPKAERIESVATDLRLGLDSFLFLDDNPAEIAAMRSRLPEVLCVTCPPGPDLESFVARLWPVVPKPATREDSARSDSYSKEQVRVMLREKLSFADFLERLQLEVDIEPLSAATIERSAQLSRRTNQFNLRPASFDESALTRWQQDGEVWTATARDRFGNYGQVGVLVLRRDGDTLEVIAWILSCRALGRGVEERLLQWLAGRAEYLGCARVRLIAENTPRNVPARRLVAALGGGDVDSQRLEVAVTLSRLREFRSWEEGSSYAGKASAANGIDHGTDRSNMNGTARNPAVDRREEGELMERSRQGPAAVADLLTRYRRPAAARDSISRLRSTEPVVPAEPGRNRQPWDLADLALAIAARAARFLDGAPVDADADFFDAGATSVNAVELVAVLARELDVRLSLDDVFADARPRRLAQRWLTTVGTGTSHVPGAVLAPRPPQPILPAPLSGDEDLAWIAADLARADLLPWVTPPEPIPPRRILLTGATGFLGSHMLGDLLRHGDADVVCLVRGSDDQDAERRLASAVASFDIPWPAQTRRRVTVLAGDIRRPHLGLTDDQWSALSQEIDSVVGAAAAVDFVRGYPSLRQANVIGPLTLAELAMTGRVKPLHHISSLAVFNDIDIAAKGEDDPVARLDRLTAGYDKAKWAAEATLRRARDHGLVVTFLRPGAILGHTRTGAYNPSDLSTGFLSAFARFRTVPAVSFINAAPVDWVSQMAAAIVCEPDGWGQTYHLVGKPTALPDLVRDLRLRGVNAHVLSWNDWQKDALARLDAQPVPELDFFARALRSRTAMTLCEATLLRPAAGGDRAEAFAARHKLPHPTRYDASAQMKTYERMAKNGLAHLPSRNDQPYLWFRRQGWPRAVTHGSKFARSREEISS